MNDGALTATRLTATGTAYTSRCRLMAIHARDGASDGTLVIRDGGSGGTVRLTLDTASVAVLDLTLPGRGVLFKTDCHVTLTNVGGVTLFYEAG